MIITYHTVTVHSLQPTWSSVYVRLADSKTAQLSLARYNCTWHQYFGTMQIAESEPGVVLTFPGERSWQRPAGSQRLSSLQARMTPLAEGA